MNFSPNVTILYVGERLVGDICEKKRMPFCFARRLKIYIFAT